MRRHRHSGESALGQVLAGCKCYLEAWNDDGEDASAKYEASVIAMGGEVVRHLSEEASHYIVSNSHPARVLAAQLLRLHVVSPLWIEQCLEARCRAKEEDFLVSQSLYRRVMFAESFPPLMCRGTRQRFSDQAWTPGENSDPHQQLVLKMPSAKFREYKLPSPLKFLSNPTIRRSERICDLDSSDEEGGERSARRSFPPAEVVEKTLFVPSPPSLDYSLVPLDQAMTVLYDLEPENVAKIRAQLMAPLPSWVAPLRRSCTSHVVITPNAYENTSTAASSMSSVASSSPTPSSESKTRAAKQKQAPCRAEEAVPSLPVPSLPQRSTAQKPAGRNPATRADITTSAPAATTASTTSGGAAGELQPGEIVLALSGFSDVDRSQLVATVRTITAAIIKNKPHAADPYSSPTVTAPKTISSASKNGTPATPAQTQGEGREFGKFCTQVRVLSDMDDLQVPFTHLISSEGNAPYVPLLIADLISLPF